MGLFNLRLRFMTYFFSVYDNKFNLLSFLLVEETNKPSACHRSLWKHEFGNKGVKWPPTHLCLLQAHSSGFLLFRCPLTSLKFLILSCKASIWKTHAWTITFEDQDFLFFFFFRSGFSMLSASLFTLLSIFHNSSSSTEMIINLETKWTQNMSISTFLLMCCR